MRVSHLATIPVIAALSLGHAAQPARADGDAIVGGIIGGIIGGAIANEANKSRKSKSSSRSSSKSSGVSSAQREANREVQTALNFFGYPVGTPDGSIGPKSRTAISAYQATLGYPPTGQLTDYERTLLVTAYQRAMAGGPVIAQTVASHPMGVKGLLLVQRDEMAGLPPAGTAPAGGVAAAAATFAAGTAAAGAAAPAAGALPALMPEAETAAAGGTALPSFMGAAGAQVSLASYCNKVNLQTNTNGGYVKAAEVSDPTLALSEQFCLARTYVMATSEEMAAKVPGFTPQQIAEQCKAFGPVLAEHVAALSLKTRPEVLSGMQAFIVNSGMQPAQLAGTAKICLGVGYTTDDMQVSIGSALILAALGERAYGELLGHHLSQGFGAQTRPDLSLAWYEMGLEAVATGNAVFAPGLPDRAEVIRKAAYTINGRTWDSAPQTEVQPAALPVLAEPAAPAPAPAPVSTEVAAKAETTAPAAEAGGGMWCKIPLPFGGQCR